MIYVLATLAIPEGWGKFYIIDFLNCVSHSTVSQSVIRHLNAYNTSLDNELAFVPDDARYMREAFREMVPNACYIGCLTHALSLVLEVWSVVFKKMSQVVALVKKVLCQSPLRHQLYCEFMESKGINPKLPVYVVLPRWGAWVDVVSYLAVYIDILKELLSSKEVVSVAAFLTELKNVLDTGFCHIKGKSSVY